MAQINDRIARLEWQMKDLAQHPCQMESHSVHGLPCSANWPNDPEMMLWCAPCKAEVWAKENTT